MKPEELSQLSDQELLQVARDNKPSPMVDAVIIGFLFGIIIYSIAVNAWGVLTLIPLYLMYRFLKKPKQYDALRQELKARNLQ